MFSPDLIFLVGFSFQRACVTRIIIYSINLDSYKILARFIPHGFEIILSILNLMQKSQSTKIHNVTDIEKRLGVDNFDKYR